MKLQLTALHREKFAPAVAGCAVAGCWFAWDQTIPDHVAKELLAAVLSVAAICAGFLTAALSVLMTMGSTPVGRRLKNRNRLTELFNYFRKAIFSCLLLCALCVMGFFAYSKDHGIGTIPSTLIVGVLAYSGAAFARIVPILITVLEQMSAPVDKKG